MKGPDEQKTTGLEINLDNLAYNMRQVSKIVDKSTLIMAVVKANAYGHGSIECAKTFLENGAHRLAVSTLVEGIELRKAGIKAPILILNYTSPSQYSYVINYNLTQNIYNYEDAKILSEKAVESNRDVNIHIKIDTGMGRVGFLPKEESIYDILNICKLPNINVEGMFSHFAKSDEKDKSYVEEQYRRFIWVVDKLKENGIEIPIKHISNSAAIIDTPEYQLDMVRAGIVLYGYYPSEDVKKHRINIKPAMTLKSCISNIKTVPKDTGIGYNQIFKTKRESVIGTIPIGYADGYSRMLTGKGEIFVKDKIVPIVGKICMDQMMIDITDIDNVNIGDEVILFGYEDDRYPTVNEIAKALGTVNYELICMMGRRIPRIYIKGENISHIVNYILD